MWGTPYHSANTVRWTAVHTHFYTYGQLKEPDNLIWLDLDCEWVSEHSEENYVGVVRTCKLHAELPATKFKPNPSCWECQPLHYPHLFWSTNLMACWVTPLTPSCGSSISRLTRLNRQIFVAFMENSVWSPLDDLKEKPAWLSLVSNIRRHWYIVTWLEPHQDLSPKPL